MTDLRRIVRIAKKQGWTVVPTKNGHKLWTSPRGDRYYSPSTGSDNFQGRGIKNLIAGLRKLGLKV